MFSDYNGIKLGNQQHKDSWKIPQYLESKQQPFK